MNLGTGRYGLPLKRELHTEDIQLSMVEEAVRVERKALPDSLFAVRERYDIVPFDPEQELPLPK